ncbi:Protein of unknown function, partial [Gryllus bimaculatus]
GVCVCAK